MNFLLYLDPYTLSEDLRLHRVPVFQKIAAALSLAGHVVTVYGEKKLADDFSPPLFQAKFLPASSEFDIFKIHADLNNALLYVNQASKEVEEIVRNDIMTVGEEPDVIISTSPTSILRKIWPSKLFLHYEVGVFNRHPFPTYHQFDPGGFHHKSILSKYPSFNLPINHQAILNLNKLKEDWLDKLGISIEQVGHWDVIYVPLPSYKNWTVKSEISYKNRLDYLISFATANKNKNIVCNEKPQHPLTQEERLEINRLKNVQLIENKDQNGIGSLLTIYCKTTFTFSPSLALQTLFWGNSLITHPDSSMFTWSKHSNAREQFAGYFATFNLMDFSEIDRHIEQWQLFNPYQ
jgi:hypothetical protein